MYKLLQLELFERHDDGREWATFVHRQGGMLCKLSYTLILEHYINYSRPMFLLLNTKSL
jgi:hypothetical protein